MDGRRANLFFQLVAARYTRGSLLITSNVPFDGWGKLFGDDVLAAAILDRLLHQSEIFAINGPSYRLKDKLPAARSVPHEGPTAAHSRALRFPLRFYCSRDSADLPALRRGAAQLPRPLLLGGVQAARLPAPPGRPQAPEPPALTHQLQRLRTLKAHTLYECPTCSERYLGVQRCPACQHFCRSLGLGGVCPHCDEVLLITDVLD